MLNITRLREFLAEAKAEIPTIKFTDMVVDDSQLIDFLKDRKPADNNFLIAIVPQFTIDGTEDRTKWQNQLMFMILAKGARRDFKNNDEYMQVYADTQATALAFVQYLLTEKTGDNSTFCGLFNELVENSISVYPIWEKAQCNGWMVEIDLLTRL